MTLTPILILKETVISGECDSGVVNNTLNDGNSVSDLIQEVEDGNYKNNGQYIKAMTLLINDLIEQGAILEENKDFLMDCTTN